MRRSKRLSNTIEKAIVDTPNENPAIFRLNEDCMRQIFSLLSIKERIKLTRVCKKWRDLIKLPWTDIKELKISFRNKADQHKIKYTLPILKQVLGYCGSSITSLTLGSWREKGFNKQVITFVIKSCLNLRSLDLKDIQLSCKVVEVLADSYSNLTHIALGSLRSGCTEAVSKLFFNNKQLKSVNFNECYSLHGRCILKLPAGSIESLSLYRFSHPKFVLKVIGNFTKLRSLRIDECNELMIVFNELLGALPNKLNLETLSVDDNRYLRKSFETIPNIRYYTNLRKIILEHDIVHDELLTIIGENCKHLTSVYLSNSSALTDAGLKNLLESSSIEKLYINNLREISDKSFASINMPSLKFFMCTFIPQWTNESLRLLMLASNNLSRIDISYCNKIDIDTLANDALNYTSNRSSQDVLNVNIKADYFSPLLNPGIRKISSHLIVTLEKFHYSSDEDSD